MTMVVSLTTENGLRFMDVIIVTIVIVVGECIALHKTYKNVL